MTANPSIDFEQRYQSHLEQSVLHHLGAELLSFSAIRVCHPGPVARQR